MKLILSVIKADIGGWVGHRKIYYEPPKAKKSGSSDEHDAINRGDGPPFILTHGNSVGKIVHASKHRKKEVFKRSKKTFNINIIIQIPQPNEPHIHILPVLLKAEPGGRNIDDRWLMNIILKLLILIIGALLSLGVALIVKILIL